MFHMFCVETGHHCFQTTHFHDSRHTILELLCAAENNVTCFDQFAYPCAYIVLQADW